ncbi:hypothetical protein Tco_0551572 [Tanacetum coccineum]
MGAQTQGRHVHDLEPNFEFISPERVYTPKPDISTANVPVSTVSAEVSTASPEVNNAAKSLVYIRRSATKRKDKGKAIMKEAEPVQKKTKLQLEQERLRSEGDKTVPELTTRSSKRVAEVELDREGSKKQKTNEASRSVQEQPKEEETELPQEDLQQMMMVILVEEVYVEALHVKYPIIDWEVYSKDIRKYWKIIRVGNHIEAYQTFNDMLKKFDRDDVTPPKFQQRSGIPLGVLLHNTQR